MKAVKFLFIAICLLFLFSCEKDKDEPKQAQFKITMTDEFDSEPRSGGHQFVFFENSFTITHTLLNLYPQYVFQKPLTDSITFEIIPGVDAEINNGTSTRFCYLYTVTIYHKDILPSVFICYAPFTYGNQHTIIYNAPEWNNNIVYAELQRSANGFQEYFDLACQKNRKNYVYRINYVTTDDTYTLNTVLTGNQTCNDLYRLKMTW